MSFKDIMDKLDYAGDGKIHYTEWRKFALEAIEDSVNSEIQGEPRQTTRFEIDIEKESIDILTCPIDIPWLYRNHQYM